MITSRYETILGEIPDGWRSKRLCGLLSSHFAGSWGDADGEQEVQVIRSTNFNDTGFLDLADVAKRYYDQKRATAICIKKNDILIERSGGGPTQPVGRIALVETDLTEYGFSNFVQLLRPNEDEIHPEYLAWVLFELHRSGIIERLQHQTTQMRNLDFRDYIRVRLPVPPRSKQSEIVQIINILNNATKNAKTEVQAARRLKTALQQQLFTKGIPDRHKRFKETKIGRMPAEWEMVELQSLARIDSGITLNKERTPSQNPRQYLTVINVQREMVDLTEIRFLEVRETEIPAKLLIPGDILVVEGHANSSEIGRAAIVTKEAEDMTYQNHLFRIRLNESVSFNEHFLLGCLNSERVRRHWNATANTSSGLNTINRRGLRKLLIPKPSDEEQFQIERLLESANDYIVFCERRNNAAERLKKSLLQNLLTGKIRLKKEVLK